MVGVHWGEVRIFTLNLDLMSDSLTSRMVGIYMLRLAPATVMFTGTGLTCGGSPTFWSMFSLLRAQLRLRARRAVMDPAIVACYNDVSNLVVLR